MNTGSRHDRDNFSRSSLMMAEVFDLASVRDAADEQIDPASLSIMRKYVADLGPTVAAMQALKAPAGISLKIEAA